MGPFNRKPRRPKPGATDFNEGIYHRPPVGMSFAKTGVVAVILILILSYFAYTKSLPWADEGYTATATFADATTVRETAPVRIAGVNVGGLTADEAQERLEAVAGRYESVPVAFTAGGATFPLRPSDVEARANWAAAAEEALERGDGPIPLRGLERLWLRTTGANVEPSVEVYEPGLAYRLNQIAAEVDAVTFDALNHYLAQRELGELTLASIGPRPLNLPR